MGRRRKSGLGEIVVLLSVLPWWASLIAAVLSYAILHALARPPAVQPGVDAAKQLGPVMVHALIAGMATFGQYLMPALCMLAAAMSMFKRRQGRDLASRVATAPSAAALDAMTWQDFERPVGEAFRQRGYSVVETGRGGADGGVDLVLRAADTHPTTPGSAPSADHGSETGVPACPVCVMTLLPHARRSWPAEGMPPSVWAPLQEA